MSLLRSKPVMWFLFLFNLGVALVAGLAFPTPRGYATSVGMGVVALGAGIGLLRARGQSATATRSGGK